MTEIKKIDTKLKIEKILNEIKKEKKKREKKGNSLPKLYDFRK